jgi:AcrR family transcriptional regulator
MTVASSLEPCLVHEALVFSSDDEYVERVVPFLHGGLAAGQPTMAVVMPASAALLRKALGNAADEVVFVDASTHYRRPARSIAEYRRYLDAELSRPGAELVRVVGEIPLEPAEQPHIDWMRYESMVNRTFADYPVWIICAYDTRVLPDDVIADALRTHPLVSTGDRNDTSAGYVEPDQFLERPVLHERARVGRGTDPFASMTISGERDLDELRGVVGRAARAAALAPTTVDDVIVAVEELVRDAVLHGSGEASVQVAREGARWHCDIVERGSDPRSNRRIGLSIADLIGERVDVAAAAGGHTVRLTFAGPPEARQRILAAASELFYQRGIRATGINTIISHSGVAKATFFKHFRTKDDLVTAWLQLPESRWLDGIRNALDASSDSPALKLLTFFDLLGDWFAQDDFRGCAFQNATAETPESAHPVRQAAHEYALEIRSYFRQAAGDAGLPNPDGTAEQLHVLAQGAIASAVATRSPEAAGPARAAAKRILTPPV